MIVLSHELPNLMENFNIYLILILLIFMYDFMLYVYVGMFYIGSTFLGGMCPLYYACELVCFIDFY